MAATRPFRIDAHRREADRELNRESRPADDGDWPDFF